MKFAIIDNNPKPMIPADGRGAGFASALADWKYGSDYEFVPYDRIADRAGDLRRTRGLILSGSAFDLAREDGSFDRGTYEKMIPEYRLLQEFRGLVLGVCFGHQLLALADEFDPGRTEFGEVRIANMALPRNAYTVLPCRITPPMPFIKGRQLWVQYHHKQEVVRNEGLLKHFEVTAASEGCAVEAMRHRRRDWFGVQFHPETGKDTEAGITARHAEAVRDGGRLLADFVRYCLAPAAKPE